MNWLARIINPGVPRSVAIACNAVAAVALVLLALNPDANLWPAVAILMPAAIALYGTALVRWLVSRRSRRQPDEFVIPEMSDAAEK
jgi:hypothetical protein